MAVTVDEAKYIFCEAEVNQRLRPNAFQVDLSAIENELAWLEQPEHHLITYFDERYPEQLRNIIDPPIALFAAGNLGELNKAKVAMVGSRRPSPTGVKITERIAGGLAELGVDIVSGMALGIDGIAHHAALAAGGSTIALLGSGIDVVYPTRHRKLYEKLISEGLVLSEYPLSLAPSKYTFPDRNRLVSGLSMGVVIIEAAQRSGTLITARLAAEQNRELMVVPGSALSDQYSGSHELIRDGAALVTSLDDVLMQLSKELSEYCIADPDLSPVTQDSRQYLQTLSADQSKVLNALDFEAASIDAIIAASGLVAEQVSVILLELELDGVVASAPEGGYIRSS